MLRDGSAIESMTREARGIVLANVDEADLRLRQRRLILGSQENVIR